MVLTYLNGKCTARCPGARPVGKFMLTKAKLVFRGVADVEYSPNDSVPCGLWLIDRQHEAILNGFEVSLSEYAIRKIQ